MNRLQAVIDTQKLFQNRLGQDVTQMSEEQRTALVKENVYFVTEELHEMARELPHVKSWKDYSQLTKEDIVDKKQKAKEEFADVFTFLMNIAIALGLSADDIYALYFEKNAINHDRQDSGYIEQGVR